MAVVLAERPAGPLYVGHYCDAAGRDHALCPALFGDPPGSVVCGCPCHWPAAARATVLAVTASPHRLR